MFLALIKRTPHTLCLMYTWVVLSTSTFHPFVAAHTLSLIPPSTVTNLYLPPYQTLSPARSFCTVLTAEMNSNTAATRGSLQLTCNHDGGTGATRSYPSHTPVRLQEEGSPIQATLAGHACIASTEHVLQCIRDRVHPIPWGSTILTRLLRGCLGPRNQSVFLVTVNSGARRCSGQQMTYTL